MAKHTSLYSLVIRPAAGGDALLRQNFLDRATMIDAAIAIERKCPHLVADYDRAGTKIYRDVETALEDARFWCGDLPKA